MNKTIERAKREHCALNQGFPDSEYIKELNNIETALENYEEITNKPVILYARTHGRTQTLIDTVCKNYKEVKITNLEDEKKLKALEIIKEKIFNKENFDWYDHSDDFTYVCLDGSVAFTKEEAELLKEVLL